MRLSEEDRQMIVEIFSNTEFEESFSSMQSFTGSTIDQYDRLADAVEEIASSYSTSGMLAAAWLEAINVRNILGDANPYAAKAAEEIRANLQGFLFSLKKDPAGVIINHLNSIRNEDRRLETLDHAISLLCSYRAALKE